MWEQPNNVYWGERAEDYMNAAGDNYLKVMIKDAGIDMDQFDKLRQETIEFWENETGKNTTELKTWECAVIMAIKK